MKIITTIVATILLIILIYVGSTPYETDKSPTVIDLSNLIPETNTKLIIPYTYYPTHLNDNSFTFILSFRNNELPFPRIGPNPSNSLTITVRINKDINKLRSSYTVKNIKNKFNPMITESGFDVFESKIGNKNKASVIHYIKHDKRNFPIVIRHTEGLNNRVYRSIGHGLELDYVFSSQLGIHEWDALDKYILNAISTFSLTNSSSGTDNT